MMQDLHTLPQVRLGIAAVAQAAPESAWTDRLGIGALHEFYAARQGDAPGLCGFALLVAVSLARAARLVWIRHADLSREAGAPYPPGLAELGIDPGSILFVRAANVGHGLQAGLEAARCASPAVAFVEISGAARAYDLTASRRLMHAARQSGNRVFLLRSAAEPAPSAAETRWQIACAPSVALAAHAPGAPRFALTLLRDRHGQEGLAWTLEWNRDRGCFDQCTGPARAATGHAAAPLSGGVVSFPLHRPGPPAGRTHRRTATG